MGILALLAVLQTAPEDLIGGLGSESPAVRDGASRELRALGDAAIPALRASLRHPDGEIRARAGELLRRVEWDGTLNPYLLSRYPPLREAFERGEFARVTAFLHEHPSKDSMLEQFETYAIRLLEQPELGWRKQGTAILRRLYEMDGYFSGPCRRPIGPLAGQITAWRLETCGDADRAWLADLAWIAFRRSSSLDRELLLRARASHAEGERALDLLRAAAGVESARPILLDTLERGPAWARPLALEVVRKIRYAAARPVVLSLLEDRDLRWQALRAIAEILDPSCEKVVLDLYRRTPHANRSWFWMVAIPRLRSREAALPLLLEALEFPEFDSFRFALEGLVELNAREAFDRCCRGMDDEKYGGQFSRAAGSLADEKTVLRLLAMLELPPGRRKDSARWALAFVSDAGAQRQVLGRLETETRPAIREVLLRAATDYWFLKSGGVGVEAILERIARTPGDPLSTQAAFHLLRMTGRDAVATAEEALLSSEHPDGQLIRQLAYYPSDRLVDRVGALSARGDYAYVVFIYLEKLGTTRAREELERIRSSSKEEGLTATLSSGPWSALKRDGATYSVEELKKFLADYLESRCIPLARDEIPLTCGMGSFSNRTGRDALEELSARRDPSLAPLFLDRLRDPSPDLQAIAVRAVGRLRAREAVPALRQLVLSADSRTRREAVRSLGEIGEPGTAEFLRSTLRDNPHAGPLALAQLGVDGRQEVAALLADDVPKAGPLGAIDLMANPDVNRRIDVVLPYEWGTPLELLPSMIEKASGVPSRLSKGVRAMIRVHERMLDRTRGDTLRDVLDSMHDVTHVTRDGALEICRVEEALEFWKLKSR